MGTQIADLAIDGGLDGRKRRRQICRLQESGQHRVAVACELFDIHHSPRW
jgi:hypothetical protein